MPTLILSPRYSDDSRRMRTAAITAGWDVLRLTSWRIPEDEPTAPTALYGEPLFAEMIAAQLNLALLDAPEDWLPNLPFPLRQREIRISTLGEARTHPDPVFVKPADGRKGFPGKVYHHGTGLPTPEACPDDTPVMLAEPVHWQSEFRCFVKDNTIQTISPYRRHGEPLTTWTATTQELDSVHTCAQRLFDEVPLPPSLVVDIGLIENRGWAVVEANTPYGSGLYGCDPHRVLEVLARGCIPRKSLSDNDAHWAAPALRFD
ncbi:ATP-grasp domain-containing protein [Nocardia sp. NPDC003482]